MKKNKWQFLKNLINSKSINDTITRKEIFELYYEEKTNKRNEYDALDVYRLYLTSITILGRYKLGIYKVNHHIKENASLSRVKNAANSQGWEHWFHNFIDD